MRTAAYWVILLWAATALAHEVSTDQSERNQSISSGIVTDGLGTLVSVTRAFSNTMTTPSERQVSGNATQASLAPPSQSVTSKPTQAVSRKPTKNPAASQTTSRKPSKKPTASQVASSRATKKPSTTIYTTPVPSVAHAAAVSSNTLADSVPVSTTTEIIASSSIAPVQTVTTTVSNAITESATPTTPAAPVRRYPCTCRDGACLCCTGYILNRFNFTTNNKACLKVEYEPDEFEFNIKLLFNQRLLYQRKINGKNPQPICLPIRRLIAVNACIKFSNVYMIGRNLHACIDFKGDWNDEIELFSVSFECFRLGADGVAVVKPEEGGGLAVPTHKPSNLGPEDYDDSARKDRRNFYIDYDDLSS